MTVPHGAPLTVWNAARRVLGLPAFALVVCIFAYGIFACGFFACGQAESRNDAPREVASKPAALTAAPAAKPQEPAAPETDPLGPAIAREPGWSKVAIDDQVPLCVFTSYLEYDKGIEPRAVKRQALKAKSPLLFGAFGPWCVHEACDQLPSLQCTISLEGNTIAVHTRYTGYHKDDSQCTEQCKPIRAACETSALDAGAYTVVYGDKTFPLQIPGVQETPCFDRE